MRLPRILRRVVAAVAVLLVLAAAGLAVIETAWFKNRLRQYAVNRANQVLAGRLSIGSMEGPLFTSVTLHDVALDLPDGRVMSADRITVAYDPLRLAGGALVFDRLEIVAPVVTVVQDDQGWNLARIVLSKPGGAVPIRALDFRQIEITGGEVTVTMPGLPTRQIHDLSASLRVSGGAAGIDLAIARLSARDDPSGLTIDELAGTFADSFARADLTWTATAPGRALSGALRGRLEAAERDLSISLDLTSVDLASLLGRESPVTDLSGHATLHAGAIAAGTTPWSFEAALTRADAMGYRASDVTATGTWAGERVVFDASGRAYGASSTVHGDWDTAVSGLTLSGRVARLDLARLPASLDVPRLSTALNGTFALQMAGSRVAGDVRLDPSTVEGARVEAGTIGHLDYAGAGTGFRYRAAGRLDGLDLHRLAAPLKVPSLDEARFDGALTGTFYASGQEGGPSTRFLAAGATLTDSIVAGADVSYARVAVTLAGSALGVDAHGAFARLALEGLGVSAAPDVLLSGDTDTLIRVADLRVPLAVDNVTVDTHTSLGDSTLGPVTLTSADIRAHLEQGRLDIEEMTGEVAGARLSGSGTIAAGPTGESDFSWSIQATDLSKVGTVVGQPLSGAILVNGTLTGPRDRLQARGTLSSHSLAWAETASALTLDSTFVLHAPGLRVDDLTGTATSEATFLTLAGQEITRASATSSYQRGQVAFDARAEADDRAVDAAGRLLVESDRLTVEVRRLGLSMSGLEWRLPEGQSASVRYGAGSIEIDGLALARGDGRLSVDGALALDGPATAPDRTLQLRANHVEVADLNRLLLGERKLAGRLDGTATITGSTAAPVVVADVTVTDGAVDDVTFGALHLATRYRNHEAHVDLTLDQSASARLSATGVVPIGGDPGRSMDVRVESTPVDLGLLQGLTSEVFGVSGQGLFNLHVTGPTSAPEVSGTARLTDGAFTLSATGAAYRQLNAELQLDAGRISIISFEVADGDGHVLRATGQATVPAGMAPAALDLQLTARDFRVLRNQYGDASVDLDLHAHGDAQAPVVDGRIALANGRIEVDRLLERTTSQAYRTTPEAIPGTGTAAGGGGSSPPGLFDRTAVDVALALDDNLVVRGRDMRVASSSIGVGDMNMTFGGSLGLKKAVGGRLTLVGALEVVRGTYTFQGRRFEVARGSDIRFRGASPIDPALGVTATREISGVTTKVQIRGTATEPGLTLSSTPSLDEGDILSLIIFNQPVNQLGSAERASLAERAGNLAAAAVAAPIADSVARALNLDSFEIRPAAGGAGPAVAFGSRFGSRVFVGVRQEFGREDVSTVSFEYRLTDFLRLVTSVAQGSSKARATRRAEGSGIDLIFVIRY
jgi:autotransporter translocation and assembly factor TamB